MADQVVLGGPPFFVCPLMREIGLGSRLAMHRELQFNPATVKKLACSAILNGHQGCVNRMSWAADGTKLVSSSDDQRLIVWDYPDSRDAIPLAVDTRHRSIIFGSQFLPMSNSAKLVSGGMDHSVQLHGLPPAGMDSAHRLQAAGPPGRRHAGQRPLKVVQPQTTVYACHNGRVKDVEVEPSNPHNFWSVGEDGYVRQFDARCSTGLQNTFQSGNAIISVNKPHLQLELKSLDICKTRPHLIAVGCEDPFVRVYDRRKLSMRSPEQGPVVSSNTEPDLQGQGPIGQPVLKLAPAHLHQRPVRHHMDMTHTTYVSFSNRGDKLVANYHGDQAYSFDVTSSGCQSASYASTQDAAQHLPPFRSRRSLVAPLPATTSCTPASPYGGGALEDLYITRSHKTAAANPRASSGEALAGQLPEKAESERRLGNHAMFDSQWDQAVGHLSRAIYLAPWAPALWLRRADALLARAWAGDALWALRDAETAHKLATSLAGGENGSDLVAGGVYVWKSHLARAQALHMLDQPQCALAALDALSRTRMPPPHPNPGSGLQLGQDAQGSSTSGSAQPGADSSQGFIGPPRPSGLNQESESESGGTSEPDVCSSEVDYDSDTPPRERFCLYLSEVEDTTRLAPAGPSTSCDEANEEQEDGLHTDRVGTPGSSPSKRRADGEGCEGAAQGRRRHKPWPSRNANDRPTSPGTTWARPLLTDYMPSGRRLLNRYIGHANVQTDIKECCFLGQSDALVAAGSDDGRVFIYDADSGAPVVVLEADDDVANCIQAHPHACVLATSGIESTITLWGVGGQVCRDHMAAGRQAKTDQHSLNRLRGDNQLKIREGPQVLRTTALHTLAEHPQLMQMLLNRFPGRAGIQALGARGGGEEESAGEGDEEEEGPSANVSCRVN